jgi:hypothetical protein
MTSPNVSGFNSGPNVTTVGTPTATLGPPQSRVNFSQSVTAVLTAATINDMGGSILGPTYRPTLTNRMVLTAASGGTTINGMQAPIAQNGELNDGWTVLMQNASASDSITFTHLNSGSLPNNQFTNQNAGSVLIPPLGAARCTYIGTKWQFA